MEEVEASGVAQSHYERNGRGACSRSLARRSASIGFSIFVVAWFAMRHAMAAARSFVEERRADVIFFCCLSFVFMLSFQNKTCDTPKSFTQAK